MLSVCEFERDKRRLEDQKRVCIKTEDKCGIEEISHCKIRKNYIEMMGEIEADIEAEK